jgi:hypothetical protein
MMNFKTTLLILSLLSSHNVSAAIAVNMKNGSLILQDSETLTLPSSDFKWELYRTYRSRSLFKGVFGQGWCSVLDSKIEFRKKEEILLTDCSSPLPIRFKLDSTASRYVNIKDSQDWIQSSFGHYTRYKNKLKSMRFNFKGEMRSLFQDKKEIEFSRDTRGLITQASINGSILMKLRWHPLLSLIEKIETNKSSVLYKYSGFQLTKVYPTEFLDQKQYNYDDLDNLTERSNKKEKLVIEYDKQEDRVLKIKSSCIDQFHYSSLKGRVISSKMTTSCPVASQGGL